MTSSFYVELHARSAFSFLEGSSVPEELVAQAAELDFPALAILDRDNVSGAARFHMAAKKARHPRAHRRRNHLHRWPPLSAASRKPNRLSESLPLDHPHENARQKRRRRSRHLKSSPNSPQASSAWLDRPDPRILDLFGAKNVYVELQRHYNRSQEARNQALIDFARHHHLPLLATNGVSHATPRIPRSPRRPHLRPPQSEPSHEAGRLLSINSERHLKSAQEMSRLFADLPEAIANTKELSDRLQFTLADLGYQFPRYPVPPGETMNSFLRKRAEEGARNRYHPNTPPTSAAAPTARSSANSRSSKNSTWPAIF